MDTLKTLRSSALLLVFLLGLLQLPALAAGVENVGHVSRIKGAVFAVQGAELRPMELRALVRRNDVLKTGPDARLEVTMLDETRLTLGADTVLSVERYDLGRAQGSVLLRLSKGAFRVATGTLAAAREGAFEVATPLATIGIRGTDFWGGLLDEGELSVLLISGKGVYIVTEGGKTEIVRNLEGVVVRSAQAPPPAPSLWSPERRERAFRTVRFD